MEIYAGAELTSAASSAENGRKKSMQGTEATKSVARSVGQSLITWQWTKRLLHWIIISAGTMSECVFLIASLWVSVNANVHQFVLMFISERSAHFLTELSTTAYVVLPECIVGLAVVVTLSHLRTWLYNKRDYRPAIWTALYGGPTLVFLLLSLATLGCSVANATFEMPTWAVVIRAVSGYWFAFTSLLYTQLGAPQERDRLANKDGIIAQLQNETRRLNDLIENQKAESAKSKQRYEDVLNTANKLNESSIQAYGAECIEWLKSGIKTASVDEINRFTGHSKRKITHAIAAGNLQISPRNKELILTSSLVEWLKKNQPTADHSSPALHLVNG